MLCILFFLFGLFGLLLYLIFEISGLYQKISHLHKILLGIIILCVNLYSPQS
jgi:hypothetical protein